MKIHHRAMLFGVASSLSLYTAAMAQGAPEVEELVVTGSRLQVTGFSAPTTTTVIGAQAIQQRAPTSIADVVNRLPSVRLSAGPAQSQRLFNTGQSPIDLRGLGGSRTLTLVDGNRFTPTADNGTVDSLALPVSLIERVDVVTGGASAAYGSDAVSGVVNFVLRKNLQGFRGSVQYGQTEHGDGVERLVSLAAGTSFAADRGHVIIGGDYAKGEGVGAIDSRKWGRLDPYLVANGAARAAGVPAQSFVNGVTYSAQTRGGLITAGPLRGTAFGPGGAPYAFQYGTVLSSLMIGGVNEKGNPNANPPLLTPNERVAVVGRAEYDFSDRVNAYVEGDYGYTNNDSYSGSYQSTAIIGIDNPFLPAATRAEMVRAGVTTVTVGRLMGDFGGTRLYTTHRTLRGIAGVSGPAFGDFTWDASLQYGETKNVNRNKDIVVGNFLSAVNAVRGADGNVTCGPAATNPNLIANPTRIPQVQPGCVPLNIFGAGSPSAAALDYITGNGGSYRVSTPTRLVAAVNLRGSPFSTWAGPVAMAVGAEVRKDTLSARPDAIAQIAGWNVSNGGGYSGEVSVKEAYAEAGVPLARDMAFAKALDVNGAVRVTDYSTSGRVTTWKVGGTWEPVDGLRMRVTRSRDIRAPSLVDLYSFSGSSGLLNITNPFNGNSGRLSQSTTGNANLLPERADTTTVGTVLEPGFAPWLKASVDYYSIDIKDAIGSVAAVDILNRCFNGEKVYCPAVTFDSSTFGIANVATQPFNLNRLQNRGLEFAVSTDFRLPNEVDLRLRFLATHVLNQKTIDRGTITDRAGSLQSSGVPEWTSVFDATLARGPLSATLSGRYFSKSKFDTTFFGPEDAGYNPALGNSLNTNRFPAAAYFDLYAEYNLKAESSTPVTVFGSIQNLADKEPAQFAATSITSGGNPYDLIGRRYRIGIRFTH